MSQQEKENLDRILNKIGSRSSSTKTKQSFKEALLSQCMQLLGDESEANVLDKTMDEVWDVILGIPFKGSPEIKNMKLNDMDKLDDTEFSIFFDNFKLQADDFTSNAYEHRSFKLAGTNFYWIPLEDFPGSQE